MVYKHSTHTKLYHLARVRSEWKLWGDALTFLIPPD